MQLIDDTTINQLATEARQSPRRRAIKRYHEHEEPVQRMLNALCDDSYVQPHCHRDPDKVELFLAVQGRLLVLIFDDAGEVARSAVLDADGPVRGVDIPPRTWHALLALTPVAIALEIIQGPYEATTHKRFATWAPVDPQAGLAWMRAKRDQVLTQG